MKRALFTLSLLVSGLVFMNFTNFSVNTTPVSIEIPGIVQQIIDKSCYECHNAASRDKKAKKKFDFDKLNFMTKSQAISEWNKVTETIIEGEMPPKKFIKNQPDKQLSRTEKQVLVDWIKGLSEQTKVTLESRLNDLVNQIVNSLSQNDKTKIAVMEFVNMQGQVTNLGKYLSEELTTRLYMTGKFEVIERQLLDKIVREQKISLSGMVDENTAVELGKILGVDAIATGTVSDLGTSVKVNARLISAESGKLLSVASVEIPKSDKVKVLLSQSVALTSSATTSGTTPQSVASQTQKKDGYIFELLEARLDGTTVICKLKVTNTTEEDKEFMIRLEGRNSSGVTFTMLYDDLGSKVKITSIKAGNRTTPMYEYPNNFKMKLFAGTSINLELRFDKMSTDANKIVLLQILFEQYPGKVIEFRNIPLEKE